MAKTRIRKLEGGIINTDKMIFELPEKSKGDALEGQMDPEIDDKVIDEETVMDGNWMTSYLERSFVSNLSARVKTKFQEYQCWA